MIFTTLSTLYFRHSLLGWASPFTLISGPLAVPDWFWFVFIFAFGSCAGSFLNVVIYRLPRDKSIVTPPSACPSCGRHIRFYDNIPLVSWLLLGAKCRYCKAPIRPRYFVIELLTGSVFLGLFILYFRSGFLPDMKPFLAGGWFIYLLHIILLGAFIAASAIDLELWVIPLSICWFVTVVGLFFSAIGIYIVEPEMVREYWLLPSATAKTGSLAIGAVIGLAVSLVLMFAGIIKRSYETENVGRTTDDGGQTTEVGGQKPVLCQESPELSEAEGSEDPASSSTTPRQAEEIEEKSDPQFNHRLEACKEVVFLLPIVICSMAAFWLFGGNKWWVNFSQHPAVSGLMGSMWGYFIGCGIIWGIRIFGTFAFGKEAMGLGDVHLMGAAGAVVGPVFVVMAFFIAPFFGLAWAGFQMFSKKIRQIPYGPFLSIGIFVVMILHDRIRDYVRFILEPLIGNV